MSSHKRGRITVQNQPPKQARIRQLEGRLNNNALVQEGEQPAEDPAELLPELEESCVQLENLIARINRTNNATQIGEWGDALRFFGGAGLPERQTERPPHF